MLKQKGVLSFRNWLSFFCLVLPINALGGLPIIYLKAVSEAVNHPYAKLDFGLIALESGFLGNLRFWGDYTTFGYKENGAREYTQDKSEHPLFKLVREFFPSPEGLLSANVNNSEKLAYHLKCPDAAILINFLCQQEDQKSAKEKIKAGKVLTKNAQKKLNRALNRLLKDIEEIRSNYNEATQSILAQVILAYAYEKAHTQEDLQAFVKALDAKLKNNGKDCEENSIWTPEGAWENMVDNATLLSWAQWALTCHYHQMTTPYTSQPLAHGSARCYDRNRDELLSEKLSDCVESGIRALLNIVMFDPDKRLFCIGHLIENKLEKVPYLKNFKRFYEEIQSQTYQVNDGSIGMRSEWNKVLAGLKKVRYVKTKEDNEIDTGLYNLYNVLAILIGQPTLNKEDHKELEIKDICEGLKNKFTSLLSIYAGQNKKVEVELSEGCKGRKDIYGTLKVHLTFLGKENCELKKVSFSIQMNPIFGRLTDLSLAKQKGIGDLVSRKVNDEIERSCLLLLASPSSEDAKLLEKNEWYGLYKARIQDSNSKIDFLERLLAQKCKNKLPHGMECKELIGELMNTIHWEDNQVVNYWRPKQDGVLTCIEAIITGEAKESKDTKDTFSCSEYFSKVKKLKIVLTLTSPYPPCLKYLKQLTHLFLDCPWLENLNILEDFKNLSCLQLRYFPAESFSPSDKKRLINLTNLTELHLSGCSLKDLRFIKLLSKLENLQISNCPKLSIAGIESLPNLATLTLHVRKEYTSYDLEVIKKCKSLRRLELRGKCLSKKEFSDLKEVLPDCIIDAEVSDNMWWYEF